MPIYEYTCKKCDHRFEQLVRTMSGSEQKFTCPACGSDQTARALSVFAAVSSGGGGKSAGDAGDSPMCGRCGGLPGSCQM